MPQWFIIFQTALAGLQAFIPIIKDGISGPPNPTAATLVTNAIQAHVALAQHAATLAQTAAATPTGGASVATGT